MDPITLDGPNSIIMVIVMVAIGLWMKRNKK